MSSKRGFAQREKFRRSGEMKKQFEQAEKERKEAWEKRWKAAFEEMGFSKEEAERKAADMN